MELSQCLSDEGDGGGRAGDDEPESIAFANPTGALVGRRRFVCVSTTTEEEGGEESLRFTQKQCSLTPSTSFEGDMVRDLTQFRNEIRLISFEFC